VAEGVATGVFGMEKVPTYAKEWQFTAKCDRIKTS
jgi:hypothetical protein